MDDGRQSSAAMSLTGILVEGGRRLYGSLRSRVRCASRGQEDAEEQGREQ